jgi:hypothetical protein
MFKSINDAEDSFTGGQYSILHVIAAYPLDANLKFKSEKVNKTIEQDKHPLATL